MAAVHYDTIIVGAGMSGLAAGIRLAWAGQSVLVLERHALWGGLNSFYKQGGRHFDTGLHALTNWSPPGTRGSQLGRILRQLRIPREALRLGPQHRSWVAFEVAGERVRLEFSNDLELLRSEVRRAFPGQVDGFEHLLTELPGYDAERMPEPGARARLAEYLGDPLLAEMLFAPPCLYGSAREDDMDWDAYGVLFRSIFLEGLGRPAGGIRTLLDLLRGRLSEEGGELRLRAGVARIRMEGTRALGVVLDDGSELGCGQLLSSAGLLETQDLLDPAPPREGPAPRAGRISVLESMSVMDRTNRELGYEDTIGFFNVGERMRFRAPEGACDVSCGVVCAPDNYLGQDPVSEGRLRVSVLAHPELWETMAPEEYGRSKALWSERSLEQAARFALDPRPHEVLRDVFTPRTIRHFTGHVGGALYGSPDKRRRGQLGLENVHLIGNDESYVGIVGALLSGITVANRVATAAAPGGAQ